MTRVLLASLMLLSLAVNANPVASRFEQPDLNIAQIKPRHILPYLQTYLNDPLYNGKQIGQSFQGRPIYRFKIGTGQVKVFMWSQMHGDESTATKALIDLLAQIKQDRKWRQSWFNKLTLYVVPMVNPDGAEAGQRFNAQGIDINRDASALQSPEARLLMQQAKQIKPDFGFNLHDQSRYYTAGNSSHPATISLLAPAYNFAKEVNAARLKAMQIIGVLKQVSDALLPQHLGRYNDTFEPRAFGDNFSAMGISTILIESGGFPEDPTRATARRLNLAMFNAAINAIASKSYQTFSQQENNRIPFNRRQLRDVLLTDITVATAPTSYHVDMTFTLNPPLGAATIREIGDLSVVNSYYQFDAKNWQYSQAKPYTVTKSLTLTTAVYLELLQQGYGYFVDVDNQLNIQTDLPVWAGLQRLDNPTPQRDQPAVFTLTHEDGRRLAVINGQLVDPNNGRVLNKVAY